jgi:hypothetical protein
MLRKISENSHFEFYVAADALHLMSGPSHDEHGRPLWDNIVDSASASQIRISGGDW